MSTDASTHLARWIIAALLTAVVAVLVMGLLEDDDLTLTPRTLAASIEREAGSGGGQPGRCVRGRGPWICTVPDRSGQGQVRYLVAVSEGRCWSARLPGGAQPAGGDMPERVSGCVEEQDGA